ncbi:lysophospholipid acyltransferase family protein [Neogemmobacter tilapiae]|uniref:1-acyl-sn-glycerol-3-phosphate acyltransferase n=1 Tax=Neogemmobacter tilapiae TaxID=875041 RepID=A0A918TLT7_9RHOB|nr:lysophospholipid acyltransferase family protein [Gemmobacter tilapiae]GHC52640.1 1-acyl-sn-glycerol-3-phosphate acyltransferase [Gemmobacter tilapiae]
MILLQWILSLIFVVQMYLAMALIGLIFLPWALLSPNGAMAACKLFCRWVIFSARLLVGLKSEIRGPIPQGAVMLAAKHQSFFDILLIFAAVPRPRFVMKKELVYAPVLGWFALRVGCIPVDRGKKGAAILKMVADAKAGGDLPSQLVIYPQGTRIAPGVKAPYKIGAAVIYGQLGQPCVPVATNVGVFWPKRSLLRKRGTAVIEFLPVIEPGLDHENFTKTVEAQVEGASDRLMAEAGFKGV